MKKNESVKKVMTANPETVHLGMKLSLVREIMENAPFHHLPVVDGDKLVGMLSSTDVLALGIMAGQNVDTRQLDAMLDHTLTIEDVMTKKLVTLSGGQTVRDAAEILAERSFHSLPVVENGKLVGIVTSSDLIRYLLEQY